MRIWIAFSFLLAGAIVFIGLGTNILINELSLNDHGKKAIIEPFDEYYKMTFSKMGIELSQIKTADINFTTETGQRIFKKGLTVTQIMLSGLNNNLDVSIEYLPENPQVTRSPGENRLHYIIIFYIFGSFFLFSCISILIIIRVEPNIFFKKQIHQ